MSLQTGWRRLKRSEPCPVCGRGGEPRNPNTHCTVTTDGSVCCCQKSGGLPSGGVPPFKRGGSGWLYRIGESSDPAYTPRAHAPRRRVNFDRLFSGWWRGVDVGPLATSLGVSPRALERLQLGWASVARNPKTGRPEIIGTPTYCRLPGTWVFPMRDAVGAVCGARIRTPSGAKYAVDGSDGAGLFVPSGLVSGQPLYMPEGPTNTAAIVTLPGIQAAGRPNNNSGVAAIVGLVRRLRPSRVLLVGDNDERFNEKLGVMQWPGREGAELTAAALAACGIHADIVFPPIEFKDARDWVRAGATASDLTSLTPAGRISA